MGSKVAVGAWAISLVACAALAGCGPVVSGGGADEQPGSGSTPVGGGDPAAAGWVNACFETFDAPPCDGARYVGFNEAYQKWVGVILCSATQYKLYLGESADGVFYQIGDYAGHGQDHCELVNPEFTIPNEDDITSGGCSGCATSADASWYANPVGTQGYSRGVFGEGFTFEPVWPEYNLYTVEWLSCGVSFPTDGAGCGGSEPPPGPLTWTAADFADSGADTPCNGERYIRYDEGYGLFVGVALCSASRYKIFLGASADGVFHSIGDYAGHGQDHCELVNPGFAIPDEDDIQSGGCTDCRTAAEAGEWYQNPVGGEGYSRAVFGEGFAFEPVWPEHNLYTVAWYECGVAIP